MHVLQIDVCLESRRWKRPMQNVSTHVLGERDVDCTRYSALQKRAHSTRLHTCGRWTTHECKLYLQDCSEPVYGVLCVLTAHLKKCQIQITGITVLTRHAKVQQKADAAYLLPVRPVRCTGWPPTTCTRPLLSLGPSNISELVT